MSYSKELIKKTMKFIAWLEEINTSLSKENNSLKEMNEKCWDEIDILKKELVKKDDENKTILKTNERLINTAIADKAVLESVLPALKKLEQSSKIEKDEKKFIKASKELNEKVNSRDMEEFYKETLTDSESGVTTSIIDSNFALRRELNEFIIDLRA